ncbi:GNAT family N-acetyltransferase [Pseudoduganella aquatica]|uniref:GNAT family N-acetyltransferase n=1 Tax=Pseudoduganella aquatica TaxID=2660641 RepID=A0A7X4HBU9_9BURK|nr:GNAT family N-acetyltransferase [Pseudoduganella aquatica]MYN07385.1 GNAT family N-acetyltransferase [Pseudoduganella aquatica]
MPVVPSIRALDPRETEQFFVYLNDHLRDNGTHGHPLFQPMPRSQSVFPEEKAVAFIKGMGIAVGQPGWRRAWAATGQDGILGHVDLRARPEGGSAHRALLGMGVHRMARRQGLGRVLVRSAMDWARQAGLEWVDLEVLSINEPARALYRDCGFRQTGEIADMFRIDGEQLAYTLMSVKL